MSRVEFIQRWIDNGLPSVSFNLLTTCTVQTLYNACLVSIGIDHVISELCSKGTILQRNYRKITILWSFSFNSFEKLEEKYLGATTKISVIMRSVIKGLHCICQVSLYDLFPMFEEKSAYIRYRMMTVLSLYNTPEVLMLCLGSIGIDCVISELCYKGTIFQRNYGKMTTKWSFSYNSFEILRGRNFGSHNMTMLYLIRVITKCIIKGLLCTCICQFSLSDLFPLFEEESSYIW